MRSSDYDLDSLEARLDVLERTVADLVGEVLRMRNLPDMVPRVGDLEYRLGLAESDTGLQDVSRRLDALEAIDHAPPTGSASSFYDPTAGILVQFGSGTTASNGYAVVTFPTAYTSTPFVVASSDPGYLYLTSADVFSVLTTQFEVVAGYSHAGGGGLGSFGFQWIAIGRKT